MGWTEEVSEVQEAVSLPVWLLCPLMRSLFLEKSICFSVWIEWVGGVGGRGMGTAFGLR